MDMDYPRLADFDILRDAYAAELVAVLSQCHTVCRNLPDPPVKFTQDTTLAEWIKGVIRKSNRPASALHGVAHWRRVLSVGMELVDVECNVLGMDARSNAFAKAVLALFSLFHDSCRENEDEDPEHGPRAAARILSVSDWMVCVFSREVIDCVSAACELHTRVNHPAWQLADEVDRLGKQTDATEWFTHVVGTCLDADRLDLPRVGIIPSAEYLWSTSACAVVS